MRTDSNSATGLGPRLNGAWSKAKRPGFISSRNRAASESGDKAVNLWVGDDGVSVGLSRFEGIWAQWLVHPTSKGRFIINRWSRKNQRVSINLWVSESDASLQICSYETQEAQWLLKPVLEMRDVRDITGKQKYSLTLILA